MLYPRAIKISHLKLKGNTCLHMKLNILDQVTPEKRSRLRNWFRVCEKLHVSLRRCCAARNVTDFAVKSSSRRAYNWQMGHGWTRAFAFTQCATEGPCCAGTKWICPVPRLPGAGDTRDTTFELLGRSPLLLPSRESAEDAAAVLSTRS